MRSGLRRRPRAKGNGDLSKVELKAAELVLGMRFFFQVQGATLERKVTIEQVAGALGRDRHTISRNLKAHAAGQVAQRGRPLELRGCDSKQVPA